VIGLDPISTVPKGGTTQRPKMTQLSLFGGQNHLAPQKIVPPISLGPSKDFATKITWPLKRFCHQNQSQNYGGIGDPISYMKQCRTSRHGILLAKIINFLEIHKAKLV